MIITIERYELMSNSYNLLENIKELYNKYNPVMD